MLIANQGFIYCPGQGSGIGTIIQGPSLQDMTLCRELAGEGGTSWVNHDHDLENPKTERPGLLCTIPQLRLA